MNEKDFLTVPLSPTEPAIAADGWPVECQRPCRRPSTGTPGTVEHCDPWHGQPDADAEVAR